MGLDGWSLPGFSDSDWDTPQMVSAPGGMLVAQMIEPIRVVETLKPVSLSNPRPGVHIFDMGQNMVGWCRLRVAGPRGTAVTLRHAETLKSDGTLYLDNLRSAKVADTYILKGNVEEIYEPRFTYHGFRFVELRGYPGTPDLSSIEGRVVHDDLESSGTWTCSNPLLNRIYRNVLWGVRGNYRSIPTDCPQRDERQGWLGDRSAESRGETYLFRVDALYSKWLQDMADAQKESGSIPDVAPAYWPFYTDNVTWPSSTVIIPGHLVEQYADSGLLARHYPSMKKWVDFMAGFLKDDLMPRDTYGDWCVPPEDPKMIHSQDPMRRTAPTVIGTAYFYHSLGLMSRYAAQLGKTADAHRYGELASRLKEAFNRTFLNADASWYDNGTQTSSVLALAFDLVPGEHRQQIFNHLVDKITRESKGHIGTGLIGCQWLLRTLSNNGRADLAYTLASQKTYPSWGYMIEKGATTVWELWNGDTADPAMNSGNHLMLVGDLITWFYEYLAGIQPDPARPGFKHIIMCPHPVGDLQYVRATHRSPYGLIESDWRRERGVFFWNVTIPVNSTGTIYVPASSGAAVLEGKAPASRARGLSFLRQENGYVVFSAQSGRYSLTSR
jgi:alpha-L-rhamnosidase